MKKFAWTLAELTIVIIVLMILSKATVSVIKSVNVNKSKIFLYSAMRNLTMANVAIKEKYENFYPTEAVDSDANDAISYDWYCYNLVSNLSLNGSANCTKNFSYNAPNFTLANGIAVYGVSSLWGNIYGDLYSKIIMIDIDGSAGQNKVGVDRFPMIVYRGVTAHKYSVDGLVDPMSCDSNNYYLTNPDGNFSGYATSYCTGATDYNLANDNQLISYSVYRVNDPEKVHFANILFAGKSAVEADCLAHGAKGLYGKLLCNAKGYQLHKQCAHEDTCSGCEADGTCPNGGTEANCNALAEANKIEVDGTKIGFKCFSLLSKPSGGMGILGGAIINEVGL